MTTKSDIDPKALILKVLQESKRDVAFDELLLKLKESGVESDESNIKSAIWLLIYDAVIDLTSQRKLRLHPESTATAHA